MGSSAVLEQARRASDNYRPGVWVGRVEDLKDPKQQNRIRVRVFHIHGHATQTPTTALPWAEVSDIGGGGFDYGSAGLVYPVGSTVWVMFEMGDDEFPVVLGGRRSKIVRDDANPQEMLTLDGKSDIDEATWKPPESNELPSDVFSEDPTALQPTRTVWYKSFKGHTILVEDADGKEFLRIIDRAGQVIELSSPVTPDANENNGEQRGTRNAIDDDQVSQDSLEGTKATILIRGIAGQELFIDGTKNKEKISILSQKRDGSQQQKITLDTAAESIEALAALLMKFDVDGTFVEIVPDKIKLGGEGDKASLDSLVQTEFDLRKTQDDKIRTAHDDHTHDVTTDFFSGIGTAAKTSLTAADAGPVGKTNSKLVTIDK